VEAAPHAHRIVQQIKAAGCKAGIAVNPGTSLALIEELLPYVDMVLIMTVNPGFGGQKFIHGMLEKIHMLRHTIQDMGFECDIEVDGGINAETSELVREAGANVLVAGSAIYCAPDAAQAIKDIRG
jgi:ribulose-phosphate 3-epimerase